MELIVAAGDCVSISISKTFTSTVSVLVLPAKSVALAVMV